MYILWKCDEESESVLGVYDNAELAKTAVETGRAVYRAEWKHKQWIDVDTKVLYREKWLCITGDDSLYPETVIFTIEKVVLNPHISNSEMDFFWDGQPQLSEE